MPYRRSRRYGTDVSRVERPSDRPTDARVGLVGMDDYGQAVVVVRSAIYHCRRHDTQSDRHDDVETAMQIDRINSNVQLLSHLMNKWIRFECRHSQLRLTHHCKMIASH